MKHQSTKDFSTISTSGVENSVENVKTVENPKNYEYTQDGTGVNIIGDSNGVDYYGAEVDSQKENQKE